MMRASRLFASLARLRQPVPVAVRDDLALLRYDSLVAQVPLLYATTIIVVGIAMLLAHPDAGFLIRFGLPGAIIALCAVRLLWWLGQRHHAPNITLARRRIRTMTAIATLIALACSGWTALGWSASVPGDRAYYPMFMAIGLLSAAFCVSTIRLTASLLLLAGLAPVLSVLMIFGDRIDRAAALLVGIAAAFLLRLVAQRHAQLIDLLQLQRQMVELAATDPLTGLANRRRLLDRLSEALAGDQRPALILLDLDGFKPVNDRHGHAVGDALLCAIAVRLREAAGPDHLTCRMGGDEFAVLLDTADAAQARALADRLLASFVKPVSVRDLKLRVGASLGYVVAARGEADPHALIAAADTRLYAAKAQTKAGDPAVLLKPTGTRG